MELQADKPQAFSILPCLHILVHTISKRDALQAYESAYYHHRTSKKTFFYQQLGNSPIVYDGSVHFARQIKGRCNAASVAAVPRGHADISPVSKWEPSVSRQQGSFLSVSQLQM